ncbi:MAG: type II secretion system protein [Micavibrio aeruginosavorus]|uniref:Type II secretion system protein n=1 Tax=Micavibrio aeruginosavorus TaxID=349221 RepID=A0A2W5Q7S4_9BACT|nr:MAG: type II secretion system protein [Micavibrio aeruginosavorus]
MRQWVCEIAYDTTSGPKKALESFYLPSEDDVRVAVQKKGGYVLSIRPHSRSPLERLLARSSWWQVNLLRGIMFRSMSTSPGVAFWKIIQAETNPMRQNILAPAREALARGLGVIDALKALNIFDKGTIAILAASERANKLAEGIPHAIHSITQKKKNARAIMGTMGWLSFDLISIVQSLFWGKDMILGWFHGNAPEKPEELEKYNRVVGNLDLTWDILIWSAFGVGGFMIWAIISFWLNRGKEDWPTARIVRKIPLIGAYLRDLGFSDSMMACARMMRGLVPINQALMQAGEATTSPEVRKYWQDTNTDLERGIGLGVAMDRDPLSRAERLELASLSDLSQVATIMESIAEMRAQAAKTKHSLIVWLAFALTGVYLAIAFGSAIYALTVMNMSMDSMMGGLTEGIL